MWEGYFGMVCASEMTVDYCRKLFESTLANRYARWKVLLIEELDAVPSKQVERYLKVALEHLRPRTCVVATSNDASGLAPSLRERFRHVIFNSDQRYFGGVCQERLAKLWDSQGLGEMPPGWSVWGMVNGSRFSMRDAVRMLSYAAEDRLLSLQSVGAA